MVKRVGYDFYREELRVIRVGERDSYTAGKWVHYSKLLLLEIADKLEVMEQISDATERKLIIPTGSRCVFEGLDHEGDVLIAFASPIEGCVETVIYFEDLQALSLV